MRLASPCSHVWFFKGLPSRIGYLLDITLRELERVLYFEAFVIVDPGEVTDLSRGEVITDELAVADAHPLGARPFAREQYIGKFTELADGVVDAAERQRFLDAVQHVSGLKGGDLGALNVRVLPEVLDKAPTIPSGIFR